MNHNNSGFVLILLLITAAIIGLATAAYFIRGKEGQKSQYESGQEALEQAKDINQKSIEQSMQIKEQLDLQNSINSQ
jgi:hypothetical protein